MGCSIGRTHRWRPPGTFLMQGHQYLETHTNEYLRSQEQKAQHVQWQVTPDVAEHSEWHAVGISTQP